MTSDQNKNQGQATIFALVAVALFAFFEFAVDGLVEEVSIDFLIGYRVLLTCVFFFGVLALLPLTGLGDGLRLYFDPRFIDVILWQRAAATIGYLVALWIAFKNTSSQAFTYAFFFLHPFWQLLFARLIGGTWPPVRKQVLPIALIFIGVILFATANSTGGKQDGAWLSGFVSSLPYHLPALLAGAGFAYTNELSAFINQKCQKHGFAFVGGLRIQKISGLRITTYTTYASLWLLPIVVPIIGAVLGVLGMTNLAESNYRLGELGLSEHILALSAACLIAALGTWLFTTAFVRARQTAPIAAIDGLIAPMAVGLDWWAGKLSAESENFGWMAGSLALIVAGAIWSAYKSE